MRLVPALPFCHGYQNGCVCRTCAARSEGVRSGALAYDASGRLRYKLRPKLADGQAVVAFMRDRDRKVPTTRAA